MPTSNSTQARSKTPRERLAERFKDEPQFPHRIRRCFMTGKQCIFCGQAMGEDKIESSKEDGVFVIMPFRPNFDTFYEWSLKPYVRAGLPDLGEDHDDRIRRADAYADMGVIMCKKICHRIQQAELVVADLSVDNPNVFYELGLTIGLNKTLLVTIDESSLDVRKEPFWNSLSLVASNAVKYPGVGYLEQNEQKLHDKACRVKLNPLKCEMKIVVLLADNSRFVQDNQAKPDPANSPASSKERVQASDHSDIAVTFEAAIRGALGVVDRNIARSSKGSPQFQQAVKMLKERIEKVKAVSGASNKSHFEVLQEPQIVRLVKSDGNHEAFVEVAKAVDSAFTCIVDLADENPHGYFWLGYCHARGINVIPIYRSTSPRNTANNDERPTEYQQAEPVSSKGIRRAVGAENAPPDEEAALRKHVLAFDIRALYCIDFRKQKIRMLAEALHGALEELIEQDVPELQRNIFWERLTREERIHIYSGAVHHESLDREVVGDWDQRTVSELVRYLASTNQSVIPQLERPVYSPTTIMSKLKGSWDNTHSLTAYVELIRGELRNKNCVIIASADVNALTEVVLAEAYEMKSHCFTELPPGRDERSDINGIDKAVIAVKPPKDSTMGDQGEGEMIPSFFSAWVRDDRKSAKSGVGEPEKARGFLVDEHVIEAPYESQWAPNIPTGGFSVLAHLVVMRNPFSDKQPSDNIIVILGGVSGPATFGLAEVLTGGTDPNKSIKAQEAERILAAINEEWDKCAFKPIGNRRGVEAIIEVSIKPSPDSQEMAGSADEQSPEVRAAVRAVETAFYDRREVNDWALVASIEDAKKADREMPSRRRAVYASIRGGNPRQFPI